MEESKILSYSFHHNERLFLKLELHLDFSFRIVSSRRREDNLDFAFLPITKTEGNPKIRRMEMATRRYGNKG